MQYILKNITFTNRGKTQKGAIAVKDGKIYKIYGEAETDFPTDFQVIDKQGLHLLPGIIDTHVHFREPGLTHKATIYSESRAAAAGGVTSFLDMPNTNPQTTSYEQLLQKKEIADKTSLINYGFFLGATSENIDQINKINPSEFPGIKAFLGSSTGNMFLSGDLVEKYFKEAQKLIVAHCEDEEIINANVTLFKEKYPNGGQASLHPQIRTQEACYKSTAHAIELATKTNARLHIAHVSTAQELSLFSKEAIENKKITGEVCVNHLSFSDKDYDRLGNLIKCNPAIKTEQDREALRKALNQGLIDTVGTDHAPHTLEEKQQPYFSAPSGIPFVQHSLNCMLSLVQQGYFSLEMLVEKMCHNPAILFGIEKRGFIKEGYHADFVLLDLKKQTTVTPENIYYKCQWSPLLNTTFTGSVEETIVNGQWAYKQGECNEQSAAKALVFA